MKSSIKAKQKNQMISHQNTLNLKGIAIILVLIGHLIGVRQINVDIRMLDLATFGVSVFLFLSGYGLFKSQQNNGMTGFFKKRFLAVYIPFVVATTFVGFYRGYFNAHWLEIVKTITFLNPTLPLDGTMWYIYFISLWYLVFLVIFSVIKNDLLRLTLLFSFAGVIFNTPLIKEFEIITFLFPFHAFTFPLGVAFAMCKKIKRSLMMVLGASCLCAFLFLFKEHFVKYELMNHIMASIVFAPALILVVSSLNIRLKILEFLGGISYEIYLFEGVMRRAIFSNNKLISCVIFFALVVCISFTFREFIRRLKSKLIHA